MTSYKISWLYFMTSLFWKPVLHPNVSWWSSNWFDIENFGAWSRAASHRRGYPPSWLVEWSNQQSQPFTGPGGLNAITSCAQLLRLKKTSTSLYTGQICFHSYDVINLQIIYEVMTSYCSASVILLTLPLYTISHITQVHSILHNHGCLF